MESLSLVWSVARLGVAPPSRHGDAGGARRFHLALARQLAWDFEKKLSKFHVLAIPFSDFEDWPVHGVICIFVSVRLRCALRLRLCL